MNDGKKPTDAVREFAERYERRIAGLENLVIEMRNDMYETMCEMLAKGGFCAPAGTAYDERMRALGLVVDECGARTKEQIAESGTKVVD